MSMVSHYVIQPHIVELLCVCFNTAVRGNSSASHTALWVVRKEQAGCRTTLRRAYMLTSRGMLSDFRVGSGGERKGYRKRIHQESNTAEHAGKTWGNHNGDVYPPLALSWVAERLDRHMCCRKLTRHLSPRI